MNLRTWISGLKNSTALRVVVGGALGSGGVLENVTRVRIMKNGVLELVWPSPSPPPPPPPPSPPPPSPPPPAPSLNVSLTSNYITGTRNVTNVNNPGPVTSGSVTASASGGTGPYSYSWELSSWDGIGSIPYPTSSATATTAFRKDTMEQLNGVSTARFVVRATDTLGATGQAYVDVDFYSYSSFPEP